MLKKDLINFINSSVRKYGKRRVGEWLEFEFDEIGFYLEDRRKSKLQHAFNCIENYYKDFPSNDFEVETKKDILIAVNRALKVV